MVGFRPAIAASLEVGAFRPDTAEDRGPVSTTMKDAIHPKYVACKVTCGCGNTFATRSTRSEITVEICGACHPFYSGKQKFVDTAGRVERFMKRYANTASKPQAKA